MYNICKYIFCQINAFSCFSCKKIFFQQILKWHENIVKYFFCCFFKLHVENLWKMITEKFCKIIIFFKVYAEGKRVGLISYTNRMASENL